MGSVHQNCKTNCTHARLVVSGLYHLSNVLHKEMAKLSNVDRARILGMLEGGRSRRDVAAQFNVCQATLSNLIRRYNETHEVKDRHRSGRPRATTPQEDRRIRLLSLRSRTTPATTIRATIRNERRVQQGLSVQTVRNRLHESGLRSRKACVKPALTERHRQVRLAWARQHVRWTREQWSHVMFSDESRFCLEGNDGRIRRTLI